RAAQPSLPKIDQRFVDGQPMGTEITNMLYDLGCVGSKSLNDGRMFPATHFFKPEGIGEVMEGNPGLDAALMQGCEHLAIAVQRGWIKLPWAWLNAAPFNADAVRGKPQRGHAVEVRLGILPPVAGNTA